MSLKVFHIVFIGASVLLAFGFGLWSVDAYLTGGTLPDLAMGLFAFVFGATLVYYGIRFLHRLRHVGYL